MSSTANDYFDSFTIDGHTFYPCMARITETKNRLSITMKDSYCGLNKPNIGLTLLEYKPNMKSGKCFIYKVSYHSSATQTNILYMVSHSRINKAVIESILESREYYPGSCKVEELRKGTYGYVFNKDDSSQNVYHISSKHLNTGKITTGIIIVMGVLVAINVYLLGRGLLELGTIASTIG